jgi:carboxyl-terminal processing protease
MSEQPEHKNANLTWLLAALIGTLSALVVNANFLPLSDDPVLRTAVTFGEMRDLIKRKYIRDVADDSLYYGSLRGVASELDPYSAFVTPDEVEDLERIMKGDFPGLGIYVTLEGGIPTVVTPIEGTPAFKSGILAGDKILSIDGETVEGLSLIEVTRKLRGPAGSEVKLEILHTGETVATEIMVTRDKIKIDSVKGARMLEPGTGIGYIRITQFHPGTKEEFEAAVKELKGQGMNKLVLDLRFNPGGIMTSAVEVADEFLDKGVIVSTVGRTDKEETTEACKGGLLLEEPLVVLVNRGSASASEILAGALQDHRRAVIIGARTYGKGSVQSTYRVDRGESRLKLTTAYYYTPEGHCPHTGARCRHPGKYCFHRSVEAELKLGGLRPNVKVEMPTEQELALRRLMHDREIERQKHDEKTTAAYDRMILSIDVQLQRAVQYLRNSGLYTQGIAAAEYGSRSQEKPLR